MRINTVTGNLDYSEYSNEIISRFICENNLKNQFIHYVADKEAVKVGIGNVNPINIYRDPNTGLMHMEISTMLGGLIMDAEHESDATVSEMSQMINLLDQNGNMHEEVYQLYKELGKIILDSVNVYQKEIDAKVNGTNRNGLYRLIGRSLIESFIKNDRGITSIAKTFVNIANENLRNNNYKIDFKLPFSAATINDSFVATISSDIVKNVIKRRYYGMQGVLTPSYDMVMTYKTADGKQMLFDKFVEYIQSMPEFSYISTQYNDGRTWWDHWMNDHDVITKSGEKVVNPLIQLVDANMLEFYDTIFDEDKQEFVEIKTIDQYEYYKYGYKRDQVEVHRGKPRNLGQCQLTYNVELDGKQYRFDEYSLDSNRIAYALRKKKGEFVENEELINLSVQFNDANLISNITEDNLYTRLLTILSNYYKKDILNLEGIKRSDILEILEQETNNLLRTIQEHDINQVLPVQLSWKKFGNQSFDVTETHVSNPTFGAFEIVMSKQNIAKLGIDPSDDINSIIDVERNAVDGKGYFYHKLNDSFNSSELSNNDNKLYDATIWIDEKPILVKINEEYDEKGIQQKPDIMLQNIINELNENKETNKKFQISRSSFINDNHKLYYNGEEFTYSSGIFHKQLSRFGHNPIDILIVNSRDRFEKLLRNKNIRLAQRNYSDETIQGAKERGEIPETIQHAYEANEYIAEQRDKQLIEQGKLRYQSFMQSLNMLGTRIPSSSMQSFSVMKVVAQTNSGLNDVYVPTAINLISGSDFKLSILKSLNFVNCWEA